MPSSDPRNYARFIPAEELGDVSQWRFGAVGATYSPAEMDVRRAEAEQAQLQLESASQTAFERGLAQGRAEANAEAQRLLQAFAQAQGQETAERLNAVVLAAQESLQEAEQTIAQGVLDLACAVARQVVRHELTVDPTAVRHVIKEALDMVLTDGKAATVRLNPQDMGMLQESLQVMFAGSAMNLIADVSIQPGGCKVESAGAVIDGSLSKRWERAVSALGLPTERAAFVPTDEGVHEALP
ncbi:MAG: flagellar assembly protein FliH [Burkholderiaceae bacterium]|jgi:flagellar assembly protein FliH|nr:flagellar assembly protein FliH [Burkholderiaceae bacterium]